MLICTSTAAPVRGTYSLTPAAGCGDVGDLVVLDTARSCSPPGVQAGGGFIEHDQVGGRCIRCCKVQHASTRITVKGDISHMVFIENVSLLMSLNIF